MEESTGAILDLSHFNPNPDFALARSAGIVAVIHKATEGASFVDPAYSSRRGLATGAGLLWGAYHFGTCADGTEQARFFLEKTEPDASVLVALDCETNPTGASMTLPQARDFVTCIQSVTGRWPGLYGGDYLKQLLAGNKDRVLAQCWLWLAQYGSSAVVPPTWDSWIMWQYTDAAQVPGIGPCDCSRFRGSEQELIAFWLPAESGNRELSGDLRRERDSGEPAFARRSHQHRNPLRRELRVETLRPDV
jgi:lysozyme